MILSRWSRSLKEQNWTAIVIEFMLLVSGVFLGIQVANRSTRNRRSGPAAMARRTVWRR